MSPFYCVLIFILTLQEFSTNLPAAAAEPKTTCNKDYVPEGTSLNCTCTDSSSGSTANVSWPGHSNTSVLIVDNVRRDDNGTVFTCLMEGQGATDRTTNVTLLVAYGPTDNTVSITSSPQYVTNETTSVTLTCTARDFYPSVTYSWSGLQCTSNGANCTFLPRPEDERKYVHCTVLNSIYQSSGHEIKGFAAYQLHFAYGPTDNTVSITSSPSVVTSETPSVTLTCTARDFYPSVTYSWSGLCTSNTAICTFTPRAEDERKYVYCTVLNSIYQSSGHEIKGFAAYQLQFASTTQSTNPPKNSLAGKANIEGLFILVCLFATTAAVEQLNSHL
ncbi:cell adhesion molecule CEACAM1-like isoform X1 [Littorina saxatilis]|uniref:Ig-like domain-containing protein n=1 Tax=Littorina saxatilis TaxID=31220 RepID=A0AAN9GFN7_9CAEN